MQVLVLLTAFLLLQPGNRAPLAPFDVAQGSPERGRGAPAETLLEPALLSRLEHGSVEGKPVPVIAGSDAKAGEIVLACEKGKCEAVEWAMKKIAFADVPPPSRTIRMVDNGAAPANTRAAIYIANSRGAQLQVLRGLWSRAGIVDEVVDVFSRHAVRGVDIRPYESIGQPEWEDDGIGVVTIVLPADASGLDRSSFIAAASAYFLATLPNAGAEALLSHLTVGAHARLAEDGRRAVAQMGSQQRASGDVLVLLGQAIEREQRRMRDFERFMPEPVDPMLRSRIADMEKGITSVWSSLGVTSSPFVPAAERLRGRAGEDRRVPVVASRRTATDAAPPAALAKMPKSREILVELKSLIDGKRSISDIRDAVSAEFGNVPLPLVVEYFEIHTKAGTITLR